MKKKRLLAALLICTAFSWQTGVQAAETIYEGLYQGTVTSGNGGVVFNNTGESAIVKASTQFINNEAYRGAAIYNYTGADLKVEDGVLFSGNTATGAAGGAVQNMGTAILGDNLIFDGNKATWGGAAIYGGSRDGQGSSTTIGNNAIFKNNTLTDAQSYGGAIYLENDEQDTTSFVLGTNSYFEGNSAYQGGAIFINEAIDVEIGNGATFNSNTATNHGGAIYNKSDIAFSDAIFTGNISNKYGGAFYNDTGANADLGDNTKFDANKANLGGAIYGNKEGSVTLGANAEFTGNTSNSHGGAIYLTNGHDLTIGDNAKFTNNTANGTLGNGGAIYSYNSKTNSNTVKIGDNAEFSNNSTLNKEGGAIYNGTNTTLEIGSNSVFTGNSANGIASKGGAIYNIGSAMTIGDNASFASNKAVQGGAIFQGIDAELSLNNAAFTQNIATGNETSSAGGAIFISEKNTQDVNITNSIFDGNKSDSAGGAILQANGSTSTINIDNTIFTNNETGAEGGALVSDSILNVTNSTFAGNKTTGTNIDPDTPLNSNGGGGAIFLYDEGKVTISNSNFDNNSSGTYGGAIGTRINASNDDSSLSVENSNFTGNIANADGGAIASFIDATVKDTSFINNTAGGNGGAIFADNNLTIAADTKDVVMSGNKAADGGDIFMNKAGSELNMNAADGKSITIASGISGESYNMNINSDSANTGSIIVNSNINNAAIDVQNGTFALAEGSGLNNSTLNMGSGTTLNTINNQVTSFGNNVTLADNVNLAVDVNLANGKGDNFANTQHGSVTITNVNAIGNTTANSISLNLAQALGIDPSNMTIADALQSQTQTVLTPIRYLQGGVSADGMMTFLPTGGSYGDFNPSIMASPVAAQLGGYLTQLNSYDEAFRNMDMYMLMTKKQRESMKLRNKYAYAGGNLGFDPVNSPYSDKSIWARPYATFENVRLKGGPKVSNVAYGTFLGGESELYDLGNGWDGMFSVYVGYNGSHQAYDGIGIYQNGGTLGIAGMAYKGNFFTGLTVNAGANAGSANTFYGTDNFSMLMAGIASKTGYNIELAEGKFIIQPSFLMSYSFVNTFDYTNAAGVHISSDPLNAIQVEPGIKFIGNLKNGWQPYLGVSMVWNIMDKTDFLANNVSLPELSVKPFVKYGIGVRKTWGERCTGFLQAYFTGGGRNGVGLQAGFRFALGKDKSFSVKSSQNMPEIPKTSVVLGSYR